MEFTSPVTRLHSQGESARVAAISQNGISLVEPMPQTKVLGQLQIQRIDFPIADIPDEKRGAIGSNTTPGTERTVETCRILQADDGGKCKIRHAEPIEIRFLNFLRIEDQRFRVAGKCKIPESRDALYRDTPFLSGKIVDRDLIEGIILGREMAAVGRPPRTAKTIGTRQHCSLVTFQVQHLNGGVERR